MSASTALCGALRFPAGLGLAAGKRRFDQVV